jgi:hypothetical protein
VFPYLGKSLDPEGRDSAIEPETIYYVLRPKDEIIAGQDTFKLIPFVDEHAMLGPSESGYLPAEKKGVHGITGEAVAFRDGVLYANLKIFSEALANTLKKGKKELSLGYRCAFVKQAGSFAGQAYDFVQRSLKGNHLALVEKGRNNVSVLDNNIVFDHFDINFGTKETAMTTPTIEDLAKRIDTLDSAIVTLTEENKALKAALDESEEKKEDKAEDEEDKTKDDKAEDEDDKEKSDKAEDEDDEEKEDKKAMDSAIEKRVDTLDETIKSMRKDGMKAILKEVSQRNALAAKLAPHTGVFDHEDKTLAEVAEYGVKKLGLTCPKGHEATALDAFLHARPFPGSVSAHAMDGAQTQGTSSVDNYLKQTA